MPGGTMASAPPGGAGWKAGPAPGGVEPGLTARDFPAWLLLHEPAWHGSSVLICRAATRPPRSAIAASQVDTCASGTPAGRGDGSAQKPAAEPSCVVRGVEKERCSKIAAGQCAGLRNFNT